MCVYVCIYIVSKKDILHSSSSSVVFYEKGALKNFAKLTKKHLRRSLFLNKIATWRSATLLKQVIRHRCLSVNFGQFLKTPILQKI